MARDFDEGSYARQRAEERQQSSWFKLKEGDNTFRILRTPPTKTVKTSFFEYSVHRDVGPKKVTVRCGIDPVSGEGDCWLCKVKIPGLRKKGMESRANALMPKPNFLVQVAKVDDKTGKMTGPFLFTPAKTVADQLLASIFGSKKRSYTDPVNGYNISINRTGTGKNDTRYGILEPDAEPSKVAKAVLDKLKPFEDLKEVPAYSADKQQAAYNGRDVVEQDDDKEHKTVRPTKRAAAPDPDEDEDDVEEDDVDDVKEDDEDADDVEEDDEPAPKSKKPAPKKPAKPPVDEDEEDEDDAEEEEEADDDDDAEDEAEEDDADDSEDDVDEEDEGDEEEEPAPKSKKPAPKKPASVPAKAPKKPAPAPPKKSPPKKPARR